MCRSLPKHGMSEGTFYAWKPKYSGMTVSEAKRLKALEDENAKLKKLLARVNARWSLDFVHDQFAGGRRFIRHWA